MAESNGNGFKVAFWVLASIILVLVFGSYAYTSAYGGKIVDNIVCNDRIRQADKSEIQSKLDQFNSLLMAKLDMQTTMMSEIKANTAGLKEKVAFNEKRLDKIEQKVR